MKKSCPSKYPTKKTKRGSVTSILKNDRLTYSKNKQRRDKSIPKNPSEEVDRINATRTIKK